METIFYVGNFKLSKMDAECQLVIGNALVLRSLGYNVVLIGNDNTYNKGKSLRNTKICYNGFDFYNLPGRSKKAFLQIGKQQKEIEALANLYDLVAVITYGTPTYAIALSPLKKWCNNKKVSFIVNVVDVPSVEHGSFIKRQLKKIDMDYRYHIYRKADGLVSISSYIRDFLWRDSTKPAIILPPLKCIDDFVKPTIVEHKDMEIVYAGCPFPTDGRSVSVEAYKDRLDIALDVICDLIKNDGLKIRFDIYGVEKEKYLRVIPRQREMIDSLPDQICFHGRIPFDECKKAVASSDALILLRDDTTMCRAGISTKVVDAITGGTPVILTPVGDISLYIKDYEHGFFVDIADLNSTKDAIKTICNMPHDRINEMKLRCYNSRVFDYRNYVTQMDVFLKALKL